MLLLLLLLLLLLKLVLLLLLLLVLLLLLLLLFLLLLLLLLLLLFLLMAISQIFVYKSVGSLLIVSICSEALIFLELGRRISVVTEDMRKTTCLF